MYAQRKSDLSATGSAIFVVVVHGLSGSGDLNSQMQVEDVDDDCLQQDSEALNVHAGTPVSNHAIA